jgi:hypothetical protein
VWATFFACVGFLLLVIAFAASQQP